MRTATIQGALPSAKAAILRDAAGSSEAFLDRHAELLDREAPLRHYTRERLFALEARTIFVAPDRVALPA